MKIRRLILLVLITITVLVAAVFLVLQRGLTWDALTVAGIRVEQGRLALDNKLNLDVARVVVSDTGGGEQKTELPEPADLRNLLRIVDVLGRLFSRIDIRRIELGELKGDFSYREQGSGFLNISGPDADIALALLTEGKRIIVDIRRFQALDANLQASGRISIHSGSLELEAQLEALVANLLPLSLDIRADRERLAFNAVGEASVTEIAPIVELFQLGPTITPWISGYTRGSEYILRGISGSIPYDDPAAILQTLRAEAIVVDTEYTFAQGLEPALAAETQVLFEQGVLHIYPRDASFYGQPGGDTYVDIDFNNGRIILTVFVRTRAQASGGVLELLEYYGIPFPYEQVSGLTDAELDVIVDLQSVGVEAIGRFVSEQSQFRFNGAVFDLEHVDIGLDTTVIQFHQLDIALDELFSASVNGVIDVGAGEGLLNIALAQFNWQTTDFSLRLLASADQALLSSFSMSPAGDTLQLAASQWKTGELAIAVDAFTTPLQLSPFSGSLEGVGFAIEGWMKGRVGGSYQGQAPYAQLSLSLREFGADSLQLAQPVANLSVVIDRLTEISSTDKTRLSLDEIDIELQPFRIAYADGEIQINKSSFRVGEGFTAGMQGFYHFSNASGGLLLHDLQLKGEDGEMQFEADSSVFVRLEHSEENLQLGISRFGLQYQMSDDGSWRLDIDDIGYLYTHSGVLQQLGLASGSLYIFSETGSLPYTFKGQLKAPGNYLLYQDGTPVADYRFAGLYSGEKVSFEVNQRVRVEWADSLQVLSHDIGFNLPLLLDAFGTPEQKDTTAGDESAVPREADQPADTGALDFRLRAHNSFIWLDHKRRIPAEKLSLSYGDEPLAAQLEYGEGLAKLNYSDGDIRLAGAGFGAEFFDPIISLAEFSGGTFDFDIEGNAEELDAVIRLENTIVKDYKHLNNMLAFINTLPGLLTFNPPDYSNHGLPVSEAYAEAHWTGDVLDIEGLLIEADELTLAGEGTIDVANETTDMTFWMNTGIKKSITRIPLLGYILAGTEEEPSLVLEVKGDLYDPEVSNSAAEGVVSYPFQLIKRTLMLPVHVAGQVQTVDEDELTE